MNEVLTALLPRLWLVHVILLACMSSCASGVVRRPALEFVSPNRANDVSGRWALQTSCGDAHLRSMLTIEGGRATVEAEGPIPEWFPLECRFLLNAQHTFDYDANSRTFALRTNGRLMVRGIHDPRRDALVARYGTERTKSTGPAWVAVRPDRLEETMSQLYLEAPGDRCDARAKGQCTEAMRSWIRQYADSLPDTLTDSHLRFQPTVFRDYVAPMFRDAVFVPVFGRGLQELSFERGSDLALLLSPDRCQPFPKLREEAIQGLLAPLRHDKYHRRYTFGMDHMVAPSFADWLNQTEAQLAEIGTGPDEVPTPQAMEAIDRVEEWLEVAIRASQGVRAEGIVTRIQESILRVKERKIGAALEALGAEGFEDVEDLRRLADFSVLLWGDYGSLDFWPGVRLKERREVLLGQQLSRFAVPWADDLNGLDGILELIDPKSTYRELLWQTDPETRASLTRHFDERYVALLRAHERDIVEAVQKSRSALACEKVRDRLLPEPKEGARDSEVRRRLRRRAEERIAALGSGRQQDEARREAAYQTRADWVRQQVSFDSIDRGDLITAYIVGDFDRIAHNRENLPFFALIDAYTMAYAERCVDDLPNDKLEIYKDHCEEWTVRGPTRECTRWGRKATGRFASPDVHRAYSKIEEVEKANTHRNLGKAIFGAAGRGNKLKLRGLQKLKDDVERFVAVNGCRHVGVVKFEANVVRFAFHEPPLVLDPQTGQSVPAIRPSLDPGRSQDLLRLVNDLLEQDAVDWVFRYGGVGVPTVQSRDGQGRPARVRADYVYDSPMGRSSGRVAVMFSAGVPRCLILDAESLCRTPNRGVVAKLVRGHYAEPL